MVDRFLDCCGIRGLLTVGRKGLTVDRGQLTGFWIVTVCYFSLTVGR